MKYQKVGVRKFCLKYGVDTKKKFPLSDAGGGPIGTRTQSAFGYIRSWEVS